MERLYFAYSTILDRAALDQWKAEHGYPGFRLPDGEIAEALDVELVFDFPSRFWAGRAAGLADRAGARAWGRLFAVDERDWPILQHKEGVVTGIAVEREVRVRAGGREVVATAFVTRPERRSGEGPVSARFVEALSRGAQSSGLPVEWLDEIRQKSKQP